MLRKNFIAFRLGKLFLNSSAPYKKSNHIPFWVHQHICWLKLREIYAGKVRLSSNRHVLADAAVYCRVDGATGVWFGGYPVCPPAVSARNVHAEGKNCHMLVRITTQLVPPREWTFWVTFAMLPPALWWFGSVHTLFCCNDIHQHFS